MAAIHGWAILPGMGKVDKDEPFTKPGKVLGTARMKDTSYGLVSLCVKIQKSGKPARGPVQVNVLPFQAGA
jgi:hypothetical protein